VSVHVDENNAIRLLGDGFRQKRIGRLVVSQPRRLDV
jgi:hypothetical protein